MAGRVIVVHGTMGSPEGNWFPWLCEVMESRGVQVICPSMPTPEGQTLDGWLHTFHLTAGTLTESDILIGHSIGAAFVLRVLEQSPVFLRAAVLVCPFARALGLPSFDPLNSTFVAAPFRWGRIRKAARQFFVFAGDNDPYVPLAYSEDIAGALDVPTQVVPGGGHLNAESGYTEFPELERLLSRMVQPEK